jgi:hypothetical protein
MEDDALRARVGRLEEDAREQRDRRDGLARDNEEAHRRIWQDLVSLARQVTAIEVRQEEQFRGLREDIAEAAQNLSALRRTMEGREVEKDRLTAAQKVALIGAIALVCASILTAIATLASSGAFG